jgi:hypothetical protein
MNGANASYQDRFFEWHSNTCSVFQLSPRDWWVTRESNTARAKAQALQARSVTRLGVTLDWLLFGAEKTAQSGHEAAWVASPSLV